MAPVTHDREVHNTTVYKDNQIPFGYYLFQRIITAGTRSIFGVPGDFNLPLLEYLYEPELVQQGLRWIGNCNELNAAYAADGFSRYSNKIGCLITTYGVGELSALNGIAGAFAENVKVLHVVGVAPTKNILKKEFQNQNLHHLVPRLHDSNFVGPDHKVYYEMVKDKVCCSAEFLTDINTACDQVDKVIEDIYRYSKPGYIFVPADFADIPVDIGNLINRPSITLEDCLPQPAGGMAQVTKIADAILDMLYHSKAPAVIGDVLTDRYGLNVDLNKLLEATQMWNFTTINGKSIINESNPNFMGLLNGKEGQQSVLSRFNKCDLVLNVGIDFNEISYGHYTFQYGSNTQVVELHPTYIRFYNTESKEEEIFRDVSFVYVLRELLNRLDSGMLHFEYDSSVHAYTPEELGLPEEDPEDHITQAYLQKNAPGFLNPGDVAVCDTGSFQFAARDFVFPSQLKYIAQGFYLSIGMALPAAVGVGIAMQDFPRHHISNNVEVPESYEPRLVLFEGDGAAQMTVQELTSMIRYQIPIEILVWNNNGYTIERAILGPTRTYNDIMPWDWTKLFGALGDFGNRVTVNTTIRTPSKLATKMKELKSNTQRDHIELVEVMLGTLDYPEQLRGMVEAGKQKASTATAAQ